MGAAPSRSSSARRSAPLGDGQPRLLRLSRDGPGEGRRADGVIELVMTCHSGGTLEIYVEPHLPAAAPLDHRDDADRRRAGRARRGRGLAGDGHRPDRRGRRVPGRARPSHRPTSAASTRASRRTSSSRARASGTRRPSAWRSPASRRTSVSSRRRPGRPSSASGCARRRRSAMSASRPCGRRRGSISVPRPPRRSPCRSSPSSSRSDAVGRDFVASPGPATVAGGLPPSITLEPVVDDIVLTDPVCGMTVEAAHARHLAEHDGIVYAFCSIGCRTRFIKEPATFLAATEYSPMQD